MTLQEALRTAKGNPIRRSSWPKRDAYLHYDGYNIVVKYPEGLVPIGTLREQDRKATDWEVAF